MAGSEVSGGGFTGFFFLFSKCSEYIVYNKNFYFRRKNNASQITTGTIRYKSWSMLGLRQGQGHGQSHTRGPWGVGRGQQLSLATSQSQAVDLGPPRAESRRLGRGSPRPGSPRPASRRSRSGQTRDGVAWSLRGAFGATPTGRSPCCCDPASAWPVVTVRRVLKGTVPSVRGRTQLPPLRRAGSGV